MWIGRSIIFLASLISCTAFADGPLDNATPFKTNHAIEVYIDQTAKEYNFNKNELRNYFKHTKYLPTVIAKMNSPFEAKPWNYYRGYFLKPDRIANGVQYWQQHKKYLEEVQKRYGVPPQVIIAILGVETFYGKEIGAYPVWDTLATLAFCYPAREKFFKKELTQYLLLTRHEKLPVLALKGSYAGALGIPQFMPSSYRNFGVNLDKGKNVDLFQDHHAAIASIANYLKKSGWKLEQPVAMKIALSKKFNPKLISSKAKPMLNAQALNKAGIELPKNYHSANKAAIIALQNEQGAEYWLAYTNFKAIMSYNPNTSYAMAVYQLSEAIKESYEQSKNQKSS